MDFLNGGSEVAQQLGSLPADGGISVMRPFIENGAAYISVCNGGDPNVAENWIPKMVANATLRRDEWKALDDAVMRISTIRLTGINDLISRGLTFQLGNAMGTTVLEWHDIGDTLEAELSMDGLTRAKSDRVNYQHNYLPIPIIHADYQINNRALTVSRNMGNGLDVTMAEFAAQKVAMKLESMLFTDSKYSYGEKDSRKQNTIYSFLNHPDRNQASLSKAWDDPTKTPKEILTDVQNMMKQAAFAHKFGPYVLYIPAAYKFVLDEDYAFANTGTIVGGTTLTIRERIMKLEGVSAIITVDMLPKDNVVMVQATPDVVRIVQGLPLQNVQWSVEGGFVHNFKVLTIQVPQIRSDQAGQSGIVHLA